MKKWSINELNLLKEYYGKVNPEKLKQILYPRKYGVKISIRISICGTIWMNEWIKQILGCGFITYNIKNYRPEYSIYECEHTKAIEIINTMRSIKELENIRFARKWDKILELENVAINKFSLSA